MAEILQTTPKTDVPKVDTAPIETGFKKYPFDASLKEEQRLGEKAVESKITAEALKTSTKAREDRKVLEEYAAQSKDDYETYKKAQPESPKFEPTQDNAMELGGLFSIIATVGVSLGGSGKLSSMNALNAMGGMLKGWQSGRKDLFEKEQKIFDKEVARIKTINDKLLKDLEQLQKLRVTNKEGALLKAAEITANHPDVNAALINAGKDDIAQQLAKRRTDAIIKMEEAAKKLGVSGKEKATQQQFIAQRAVTALRGAASAAESIMKLPGYSNVGVLPFLSTKDGMINYVTNSAGRTLSAQETKAMQTLFSGVSRYLATIEASGTATGLTVLAGQLDKLTPMKGDTVLDTALKIADIRRISTEAILAMVESGLLPDQQGKAAMVQVERMEKAIPYTTDDVVETITRGRKTLKTATEQSISRKSYATEADALAAQDRGEIKKNDKITIGGKPFTVE
jgi:hypothetical protein